MCVASLPAVIVTARLIDSVADARRVELDVSLLTGNASDFLKIGVAAAGRGDFDTLRAVLAERPQWLYRVGSHGRTMLWEAAYRGQSQSSFFPVHARRSSEYLARHIAESPVLIMACIECIKHDGGPSPVFRGSSIYPAVQNLLLAARGRGLGSCLTGLHKYYEDEVKELLDIPENVETAALLPVGFPADNARYGPTRRAPVEEVTFREKWDQAW